MESRWYRGAAEVVTYELDALLGTKLRALYQRRKGRDLFDLATALEDERTEPPRIIAAFQQYMDHGQHRVTRALFEQNIATKLSDPQFAADIGPLLSHSNLDHPSCSSYRGRPGLGHSSTVAALTSPSG